MSFETKRVDQLLSPAEAIPSRSVSLPLNAGDLDLTLLGSENLTNTDGSMGAGGSVLTSAGGGIPTDATYAGGQLTVVGGTNAGTYTIVSTTATTVTISGTFVNALSSQTFRISRDPGYLKPFARRITCAGGGNVKFKLLSDLASNALTVGWRTKTLAAGQEITGAFVAVASTSNGTTATGLVAEQ